MPTLSQTQAHHYPLRSRHSVNQAQAKYFPTTNQQTNQHCRRPNHWPSARVSPPDQLLDRFRQGQFIIYWRRPGSKNLGDYFTQHHPVWHHHHMRHHFLNEPTNNNNTNLAITSMSCEGVLILALMDAPQTNCMWSNESRTHNLVHALGKATQQVAQ
jgi:hypothetical protein